MSRFLLATLVGLRVIRVEKELLVVHQQQVNLHGGATLFQIPRSYSQVVGSRKGGTAFRAGLQATISPPAYHPR